MTCLGAFWNCFELLRRLRRARAPSAPYGYAIGLTPGLSAER